MNRAKVIDNVHVYHHNMAGRTFHVSFRDWLRELFRECSMSLSSVNAAVASGKAVELLRRRLGGHYGISDISVDSGGRECDKLEINIRIQTSEPVTDHARRLFEHAIEYEIHLVNGRYRTNIRPMYSFR
jgi:hypothetical protein